MTRESRNLQLQPPDLPSQGIVLARDVGSLRLTVANAFSMCLALLLLSISNIILDRKYAVDQAMALVYIVRHDIFRADFDFIMQSCIPGLIQSELDEFLKSKAKVHRWQSNILTR